MHELISTYRGLGALSCLKWTRCNIRGIASCMRCKGWKHCEIIISNATLTYACTSSATIHTHGNKTAKLRSQRIKRGPPKSENVSNMFQRKDSWFHIYSTGHIADVLQYRTIQSSYCGNPSEWWYEPNRVRSQSCANFLNKYLLSEIKHVS